MTDEHCPECGAFGIVRREPCETVVVCPNDDCPRIIISWCGMSGYVCTFDRIGRSHDVPPLTVESDDPYVVAENVYDYARRYLASKDVDVTVDLETMRGVIGRGRFGSFTLAATS